MKNIIKIEFNNERFLTTSQLAEVYETDVNNIQSNFKRNISNTDYYKVLFDFSLQIIKGENDIFLNLLKHEYLLYNKKKWIPDFLDRIY